MSTPTPTIKVQFSNLEAQTWTPESGSNINAELPEALEVVNEPDGSLRFTNVSTEDFGGGLITLKGAYPPLPGVSLPYAGLDFEVLISPQDLPNLARLECDLKVAETAAPAGGTAANIANGSGQLSLPDGNWEINNEAAGWIDSGYVPGAPPAGVWVPVSLRFLFGATFSVLSVNVNAPTPFLVPAALQGLALQASNWAAVWAIQFQTEITQPGAVNVSYRAITLTFCNGPF